MFARTQSKNLRDQAQDLVDQITPHVENAVETARDQLAPRIADVREKAAPYAADARERLVNDVLPAVQSTIADAREQAGPVADEARRRGMAAAAALKGEQPRKRGRKKWFALLALVGGAAVAAKKVLGDQGGSHSAYPAPTPPTSRAAHDAAGATPGEAVADSDESPQPVTTPSDPAEVVELREP